MKGLVIIFFLLATSYTQAGYQNGYIQYFYARASDSLHYVLLKNGIAKAESPDCATKTYWMIKDENSAAGKTQISLLLAAQLAGKKIAISGTNTCTRWGDGEDIQYINIID